MKEEITAEGYKDTTAKRRYQSWKDKYKQISPNRDIALDGWHTKYMDFDIIPADKQGGRFK